MAYDFEMVHQLIHMTDHSEDETLMVALDTKEILVICAALTLLYHLQPCLVEDIDYLSRRLDELMEHQWGGDDESI